MIRKHILFVDLITCEKAQESEDEVRISLLVGNNVVASRFVELSKASPTRKFEQFSAEFDDTIDLKIVEEDRLSVPLFGSISTADDVIDSDTIWGLVNPADAGKTFTRTFAGDGAKYVLTMRIEFNPAFAAGSDRRAAAIAQVHATSAAALQAVGGKVWPNISASKLRSDLLFRLNNSDLSMFPAGSMNDPANLLPMQGPANLCGPAAIVFELLTRRPDRYVAMVLELYATGAFHGRTRKFVAGEDLRNSTLMHKNQSMNAADWMLMATLRDDMNLIMDYAGSNAAAAIQFDNTDLFDMAAGGSAIGAMQEWCGEVLRMHPWYETTLLWGEKDGLEKALEVVNGGGVAFIMCSSGLVKDDKNDFKDLELALFPTHWVAMTGGFPGKPLVVESKSIFGDDKIALQLFSWGSLWNIERGEEDFEDETWGYVYAKNSWDSL